MYGTLDVVDDVDCERRVAGVGDGHVVGDITRVGHHRRIDGFRDVDGGTQDIDMGDVCV